MEFIGKFTKTLEEFLWHTYHVSKSDKYLMKWFDFPFPYRFYFRAEMLNSTPVQCNYFNYFFH